MASIRLAALVLAAVAQLAMLAAVTAAQAQQPPKPDEVSPAETRSAQGGAADTFNATPDIVFRVQQRLYDFGLRLQDMDGNLNQETVRGLVQFQTFANLNPDGRLTRATIERLMTTPAPAPWVTIAFDGAGNFAPEIGRTRRESELEAIRRLQRRSKSDFKLSSVAAPNCLGFAVTRYTERGRRGRTTYTQAFTAAGDSLDAAGRHAFDFCEREKGGGQCQVRYALCADGSGGSRAPAEADRGRRRDRDGQAQRDDLPVPRFDPKSIPVHGAGPRFDPGSLPLNAPPPQERSSIPTMRSDPDVPAVNAPRR
ncbi:peptidoglycan-binding protein [Pseudorhodoplanes sp.]|uniref:peptidoglycan-binding protein n=1 Tax=Pseudorhodoplanes sp. TaxID=1934341 RepID=UPI00391B6E81